MSDQREGAQGPRDAANKTRLEAGQPARYPIVDQTDAVQGEPRSFDPAADVATPRDRDACPASMTDGRMGPGGDPAEGKREG
jgi:hypothetical protein